MGSRKIEFIATAQEVKECLFANVGVWTDGIGVYADSGIPLKKGKRYKVTVEEEP